MADAPTPQVPPVEKTAVIPLRTRLVLDRVPKRGIIKRTFFFLCFLGVLFAHIGFIVAIVLYAKYSVGLPKLPSVQDYRPPILAEFWTGDRVLAVREPVADMVAALGAHTPLSQEAHVALAHLADAPGEVRNAGAAGDEDRRPGTPA